MIMVVRMLSLCTTVRLEATILNETPQSHPRHTNPTPRLSFAKPSWVVRTESNVHREEKKKPDPPCVVCMGSGRTECHTCRGRGRTNCSHVEMLPKGEWPKWCRACGGSGLDYCPRCLGTGEYRYVMGFQFMKRDANYTRDHNKRGSVADFYEE